MDYFIEIENLSKTIKKQVILDHINLHLEKGKIYGFVGRNGSGKSMLFKAICGFITPDEGQLKVHGKRIGEDVDFPDSTGAIIEKPGLIPYLTAFENLKTFASIQKRIDDEQIRKVLDLVGLDPNSSKKVRAFSLGMKQRLGIAQAIMENPELLILDEPMNGLDQEGVEDIKQIIRQMHDNGCTILLSSHIAGDIEELADQVFYMDRGVLSERKE